MSDNATFDPRPATVGQIPQVNPDDTLIHEGTQTAAERNGIRARWAGEALTFYATRVNERDEAPEVLLADLLADLRHLADACGIGADFDGINESAGRRYDEEINGEG